MRRPTPLMVLYRWHTAAMRGQAPEIHEGEPQAGWFRTRLVKAGPWVPARIWWEQPIDPETGELTGPETLRCTVRLEQRDPFRVWTWLAGNPISRADYLRLVDEIARCEREDPTNPVLFPEQPINLTRRPSCLTPRR